CSPDPPLPSSARLSLSAAPPFISRRSAAARALHSFPTRRSSDLVAVTSLGHAHPEIAAVIAEQAGALLHTSNVFRIDWQEQLGERLCALTGMESAFFCNSGAEANETALKLARLHAHRRQVARPQILVMGNAFHGRTLATLAATDNAANQQGFGPLLPG